MLQSLHIDQSNITGYVRGSLPGGDRTVTNRQKNDAPWIVRATAGSGCCTLRKQWAGGNWDRM
jgi:hypothetical protein